MRLVEAAELHRAPEPQPTVHRGDRHVGFAEDGADPGQLPRPSQGEAVAFARLQGKAQAEIAHHRSRPRPRAQHVLVGDEVAAGRPQGGEPIVRGAPTGERGIPEDHGAGLLGPSAEERQEPAG